MLDIETAERLVVLEEITKKNREDVKEIKIMLQDLHDQVLANNVAQRTVLKVAAFVTAMGGFFISFWKFFIDTGGQT